MICKSCGIEIGDYDEDWNLDRLCKTCYKLREKAIDFKKPKLKRAKRRPKPKTKPNFEFFGTSG